MDRIKEHIRSFTANYQNCNHVVACSGGLDSMVLLHALLNEGLKVEVFHCNYQLRGHDSEQDEQLVRAYCSRENIPFHAKKVNLKNELSNGGNLQELARIHRYQALKELWDGDTDTFVHVAHHWDDQMETFYLNLARKSGVMGLSGMLDRYDWILRPLLPFKKEELLQYAKEHQIQWREDQSNQSLKYSRNKLRNEFLPYLQSQIPELDGSVQLLIQTFQNYQLALESKIKPISEFVKLSDQLLFSVWNELDEFEHVELFRQLGLGTKLLETIQRFQTRGASTQINHPNWEMISYELDHFALHKLSPAMQLPELRIEKVNALPKNFNLLSIYLNPEKLKGQLQLRPWRNGDRIASVGLKGTQLVSDIIKDAKLTTAEKRNVLVLCDDENIHWVVNLKVGRKAIATDGTCWKVNLAT